MYKRQELANASLLDEGTAAAEAMTMLYGQRPAERNSAEAYFVSELCLPQTIDLLKTRAEPIGIEIVVGDHRNFDVTDSRFYGMMLQYPASNGEVFDYSALIAAAKENGLQVVVAADLLALTLLTPPGEMGADAVVGVHNASVYRWASVDHTLDSSQPKKNTSVIFQVVSSVFL